MSKRKKTGEFGNLVGEFREGDGVDPREEKTSKLARIRRGKPNYSVLRLAGEIERVLNSALAQAKDPALESITVSSVMPSTSGTTFIAQIYSTDVEAEYDPTKVRALLTAMRPGLRAEGARAVNRKNAPNFTFDVLPPHVQPR